MVDPITGIDTEQAKLADIVNRQNVGTSQRFRNEQIRKQTQSGQSPDLSSLQTTSDLSQGYDWGLSNDTGQYVDPFGQTKYKSVDYAPTFSKNDPTFQSLSSKYAYQMPNTQREAFVEGGPGYDIRHGPYGSFDLGNNLFLVPKLNKTKAPFGVPANNESLLNKDYYNPLNSDNTLNLDNWEVMKHGGHALGSLVSTLQVLAPAVTGYLNAPTGGTPGSLGSENMFFGGTDAIAGPTTSSGIFNQKNLDLGNKYLNRSAEGALKSFLFSGGDPKAAMQGGIVGPAGSYVSDSLNPIFGDIASKSLGGAASGALASLFTKNSPIAGSLYGGMSGGLNAYLNSVNKDSDQFNKLVSHTGTGLLKKHLFGNK